MRSDASNWTVILEPDEDGGFVATIAEYPFVVSEGDTADEARESVIEVLYECLELDRNRALAEKSSSALVLTA